ncbi:MAG: DMT family transporter [Albidovulum sp.]|uniref:DMT family transporter n=1 Tax=Albidovulum sp. TaxID=1872424 RepID=UPI003CA9DA5A
MSGNLRGALFMTLAMAAFAINDSCMKAVTADLPLAQAIFLRGALAAAALGLIGLYRGRLRLRFARSDAQRLGLRSLGEVAATLIFLTALRHMPLANLSAIMQALPLAVTLSAALIMREPVGWRRMAAIGVGFCGVLLIVRPGTDGFDRWSLLALVSVAFVVVRDLSTRRLSPDVPSVSVAFLAAISVTISAVFLLPFSDWAVVGPTQSMLIIGAATFLIAGYLLIVMAMRVGEIGLVAPFRYTALLFSIVLGWAAFSELPDAITLMGAAVIVATGIYTFYRERKVGQVVATPVKAPLHLR